MHTIDMHNAKLGLTVEVKFVLIRRQHLAFTESAADRLLATRQSRGLAAGRFYMPGTQRERCPKCDKPMLEFPRRRIERIEASAMPHYRVHILDQRGDLKDTVAFDCADDKKAKESVRALLADLGGEYSAELWRLIAPLEPDTPPTEPKSDGIAFGEE